MKNNFLSLLVLAFVILCCPLIAQAQLQTEKQELSIGFGNWSPVQLLEGVHSGEDGYSEYAINKSAGIFSLTYKYFIGAKIYVGIAVAFENESGDWNTEQGYTNVITQGTFKRNVYNIAPEVGFIYSQSRNLPVVAYGYLGLGGNYLNEVDAYSLNYYNTQYNNGFNPLGNNLQESNNRSKWAGQVCPIGLSFGGKLRGFAELGFGYKGIVNMGMLIKL